MGCSTCKIYSRKLGRCANGKVNPRTIKGAAEAARIMGISYICNIDKMKDKVIEVLKKENQ